MPRGFVSKYLKVVKWRHIQDGCREDYSVTWYVISMHILTVCYIHLLYQCTKMSRLIEAGLLKLTFILTLPSIPSIGVSLAWKAQILVPWKYLLAVLEELFLSIVLSYDRQRYYLIVLSVNFCYWCPNVLYSFIRTTYSHIV